MIDENLIVGLSQNNRNTLAGNPNPIINDTIYFNRSKLTEEGINNFLSTPNSKKIIKNIDIKKLKKEQWDILLTNPKVINYIKLNSEKLNENIWKNPAIFINKTTHSRSRSKSRSTKRARLE
jgi:hypothetical protein